MSHEIHWVLELEVKGQRAEFEALVKEMVAATRNEPGTLNYEWNLDEKGSVCHIYERYRDSKSVIAHLDTFGAKFAKRFMAVLEPKRLTVYGAPDKDLKPRLDKLGARYLAAFAGFKR